MKKKKFPKDCKPTGKRYSSVKELCKDTGFDLEKYTTEYEPLSGMVKVDPGERGTLKFKSDYPCYLKIPKTGWDMEINPSVRFNNIKPVNWFHRTMQRLILGFKWIRNGDKSE